MSDPFTVTIGAVLVALIAAVPATIAAINSISAKQAASTAKDVAHDATRKLDQLTINVDGRLALLMEKVEEAAQARGKAEGIAEEQARVIEGERRQKEGE